MRKKGPVTAPPELPTTPLRTVGAAPPTPAPGRLRRSVAAAIALLCLVAVLMEATVDVLPDEGLVGVLTPLRLVLGAGLVAVSLAGVRPLSLRTPLDLPIGLLLVAAAGSIVLARQDFARWRGLLTVVAGYYLVVGVRRALPDSWPSLGLLGLVGVGVAATTAIRQTVDGTSTGFCRGTLDGTADVCAPDAFIRAVGTFSNPNLLAAFLLLLVPVAIGGGLALADRPSRWVAAAVAGAGVVAMAFTVSRGGWLAAVAGAAAFLVLRNPTRLRLLLGAAGAAVAAALFALAVALGYGVGVREDVWGAAAALLVREPLGVGLGRGGALLDSGIAGGEEFQHAHNLWLNFALETGVPGLVAVLAITVLVTVATIRGARAGSPVAVAAGAGLAGFAVMSLADHPANALRIALVLWAVLALVAADSPPRTARRRRGARRAAADSRSGRTSSHRRTEDPRADPETAVQPAVPPIPAPRRPQPPTGVRSRSGSR